MLMEMCERRADLLCNREDGAQVEHALLHTWPVVTCCKLKVAVCLQDTSKRCVGRVINEVGENDVSRPVCVCACLAEADGQDVVVRMVKDGLVKRCDVFEAE